MNIVINGGGMVAEYLSRTLLEQGHRVAIIEIDEEAAQRIATALPNEVLVICGDGCDSTTQRDAGMDKADIFVATTSRDEDNLVACEIAQLVFDIPRAIARVNSPRNERIFRQVGIEAVSSTTVITRLIEAEMSMGSVQAAASLSREDIEMGEVVVPSVRGDSNGRVAVRVHDIRMPEGSLLVAVRRGKNTDVVGSDTTLRAGDIAVYVADSSVVDRVRHLLSTL